MLRSAGSWLLPVKLPLLAGTLPASREQMAHDGELTGTDLGRRGNGLAELCGCEPARQPQRPRKPCSPAHTSHVKLRFVGQHNPHSWACPFCQSMLNSQPQWVGGDTLMSNGQCFMLVSDDSSGTSLFQHWQWEE